MVTDRALQTFFERFGKAVMKGDTSKLAGAFAIRKEGRRGGLYLHRVDRQQRRTAHPGRTSLVSTVFS